MGLNKSREAARLGWDKYGYGKVTLVYGISRITVFVLPAEAYLRIPSLLLLLFAQMGGISYSRWETSSVI